MIVTFQNLFKTKDLINIWVCYVSLLHGYNASIDCKLSTAIYTERQKKLITSSEQHSLKSKASKLIIILTQISFPFYHIKKPPKVCLRQKAEKWGWKVFFQKTEKVFTYRAGDSPQTKTSAAVIIIRHWNYWMNDYSCSVLWICCLRGARSMSSFSDLKKKKKSLPYAISTCFSSFWHKQTLFLQMFL